jgi:cathepsin D
MLPSIIILAVSLSSSLAAVPPRSDDTLHIPIRRRSNVRRQDPGVHRYASAASALRHKYGFEPSPHERRAQTTDIGITNQVCALLQLTTVSVSQFVTQQGLGYKLLCASQRRHAVSVKPSESVFAPPSHTLCFYVVFRAQSFDLVLDTGSSDLWFTTTGCAGCSQNTPVLNPTKSSSFSSGSQTVALNYGSGSASGLLAHDTVSLGPFTVNPQVFGVYPFSPTTSVSTTLSPG